MTGLDGTDNMSPLIIERFILPRAPQTRNGRAFLSSLGGNKLAWHAVSPQYHRVGLFCACEALL